MYKLSIKRVSGDVYREIIVDKLNNTYLEVKLLFCELELDKFYNILNGTDIIYTNLYDSDYDSVELNTNLTIVFLPYDKDFIDTLKTNKYLLNYLSREYRSDIVFIKTACASNGYTLQYASDELKNNFEIVKIACSNYGKALRHASEELKNNFEIVKIACINNKNALVFASKELRKNPELIALCKKNE